MSSAGGLAKTVCAVCHQGTLYADKDGDRKKKPPLTCGRLACGKKAGEEWAA